MERARALAVVAVHGVGQQRPGESARAIGDLLLRLRAPDGTPRFSALRELPLRLPTTPLRLTPRVAAQDGPPATAESPFREQSDALAAQLAEPSNDTTYAPEYEFMRAQLEGYASSCDPYDTIRLEGTRIPDAHGPEAKHASAAPTPVHVYEMYWADLSRVGSGPFRVFGAFYQLLFNVAHLGRLAVDHAALTFPGHTGWRRYARLHTSAVRLLTIFVPISWLSMLATSLGLLVLALPTPAKTIAIDVVAGVAVAAALAAVLRGTGARGITWWVVPAGAIVTANTAGELVRRAVAADAIGGTLLVDRFFVCAWTLVASGALMAIYRGYERFRPGAFSAGVITTTIVALVSMVYVPWAPSVDSLLARTLDVFAVETALTVALWYGFYATGAISFAVGALAERGLSPQHRGTARAARTTASATLALSASAVLVVTFTLWSITLAGSRPLLRALDPAMLHFQLPWFTATTPESTIAHYFAQILAASAGAGYPFLLWCLMALGLLVLVALGPSLLLELTAPTRPHGIVGHAIGTNEPPARDLRIGEAQQTDDASEREGQRLDQGLTLLERSAILLFLATFVFQPLVSILHWLDASTSCCAPVRDGLSWLYANGAQWVTWSGSLIVIAGIGVLLLRDRIGPLIDTALDVDNYLREHPRSATPRARIAERYAALLRHLNAWRDTEGRPYERVVLISHSQGTVITVELLGFARCERDANPDLFPLLDAESSADAPRLALFTMGSPLRQLYQRAFPTLFEWMNATRSRWGTALGLVTAQHAVPDADAPLHGGTDAQHGRLTDMHGPRPEPFGLWRWVNAYRSSDYVGRAFWREDADPVRYRAASAGSDAGSVVASEDASGRRRELCLGRGAHTQYWNASAYPVAAALDQLLTEPIDRHDLAGT